MKGTEYFVSLQTGVGQAEESNFMFSSEQLIDTTEYWTPWARCPVNRCRYDGIPLYSTVYPPHPVFSMY